MVVRVGTKFGPMSPEHRRKIGDAKRGRPKSADHRRKLSEAARRNQPSGWYHHTAEAREKIRSALIGHPVSPETREKLSRASRGRTLSAERRAQMSSSTLARNATRRVGECGICRQSRPLYWDHDHDSGAFRGWLCLTCNTALGALGDSVPALLRAIDYLKGGSDVEAKA